MEARPNSLGIGIASVELLMRNNDIAQALSVATRLQSTLAQDPEAMAILAKVQVAAGQPSSAVASLRLMAHKAPGAGDIELAKLLFSLGRRDEARVAIDGGLVKVPAQFVLWQMRLADEKQRRGAKAALALAETARSVSGALADTLIGDLWMDQGKPDEAAKAYHAALDTGGPANAHLLLQRLMRALVGANRIDDAAQTIRTWLTGHPADLSAAEALGDLLFSAGRLQEAAAAYQDVLAHDSNNVNSLNDMALVQAQLHQEDQAIETARRAHAIAPGNAAVADTLGWLLVGRGAAQEGLPLLRQAHQGSGDPVIAYHLAAACEKTGDRAQALALLAPLVKAPAFSEQAEAMALYRKLGGG
jgi:predicted Zn-dependent protease